MDKYKILFETVFSVGDLLKVNYTHMHGFILPKDWETDSAKLNDCIVISTTKYYMIYNFRLHKFVDVNGELKFKKVPLPENCNSWHMSGGDMLFFEVKKGKFDIALINKNTCKPLVLPNGECWFNDVKGGKEDYWERGNKVFAHFLGNNAYPVLQIMYDMSSKENYFYNTILKQFINLENDFDFLPKRISNDTLEVSKLVPRLKEDSYGNERNKFSFFGYCYSQDFGASLYYDNYKTPFKFLNAKNYEEVSIFGLNYFDYMKPAPGNMDVYQMAAKETLTKYRFKNDDALYKANYFKSKYFKTNRGYVENSYVTDEILYDAVLKQPLIIGGNFVMADKVSSDKNLLYIRLSSSSPMIDTDYRHSSYSSYVIYDMEKRMFIKNNSGFPSHKYFMFAYMSSYYSDNAKEIGWYFPTPESYNDGYETENMIKINDWNEVNEGCVKLEYGNYEYFPNEYYDWQEEFEQFKLNHPLENSEESNLQESIRFMVESVIRNLLNEKRMAN